MTAIAKAARFQGLTTERLTVRRFQMSDLDAFVAIRNDPEVARFQSWSALDQVAAQVFIADMSSAEPGVAGEWFQFALADKSTNRLIGDCALHIKADEPRHAEIGFTLARHAQGQGLATEALIALFHYLFQTHELQRLIAICDVRNRGSIALLERLGMRREGHTLQSFWNKGSWTDEYQYALLRDEWLHRIKSSVQASQATKVVLLGTGTPNADPMRHGASLAIVVKDQAYLVDFGPGVVRRAAAAAAKQIPALAPPRLTSAFLTHHHSDHTAGYADLILTPWVLGRNEPLVVYGPPGTQAMTDHLLAAYAEDIRERREGLEPSNDQGQRVIVHEYSAGEIYADANVRVEAFRVDHGSWPAFGFKFHTPDRVIGISGDTRPFPGLADYYRGCDVLIHEVYSVRGFANRPAEWQRYHSHVHTSTHELADLANQARPGLLVLVHQLFWGVTEADLLAEVRERYNGPVVSGRDLDVY